MSDSHKSSVENDIIKDTNTNFQPSPLEIEKLPPTDEDHDDDNSLFSSHSIHAKSVSRLARTNLHFFIGSFLYVLLAIWDLPDKDQRDYPSKVRLPDTDADIMENDDFYDIHISTHVIAVSVDQVLSGLAAIFYVLDSLVYLKHLLDSTGKASIVESTHYLLHNLQEFYLQISFAFTFGLAAILEFTSNLNDSAILRSISNHVYLLNSMLMLSGRNKWRIHSIPSAFEIIGDFLFAIGSVTDVILSYWYFRVVGQMGDDVDAGAADRAVAMGDLFSAGLWLMDAILYIAAGYCTNNSCNSKGGEYQVVAGGDENEMADIEEVISHLSFSPSYDTNLPCWPKNPV